MNRVLFLAILIFAFKSKLSKLTLGPEMDYSLGLKILSKIEEKFRDNRFSTVFSMDTIEDEDNDSIPLGLFAAR
ncbi:MAG: hypothetical protein R2759_13365 [Bacteroidales bacterium]